MKFSRNTTVGNTSIESRVRFDRSYNPGRPITLEEQLKAARKANVRFSKAK